MSNEIEYLENTTYQKYFKINRARKMSNVYKTLTETSERKRKSQIKTKTKMATKFSECDVEQIGRNLVET